MLLTKPLAILICACLYRLVLGTLLSFAVGKMTATVFLAEMRYSVYLLYWYKSTNTDAEGAAEHRIHRYLRLESEAGKQKKKEKKNARMLLAKNIRLMLNTSNV
jgi:hypothetical protein